jgi:hypothetical protein
MDVGENSKELQQLSLLMVQPAKLSYIGTKHTGLGKKKSKSNIFYRRRHESP